MRNTHTHTQHIWRKHQKKVRRIERTQTHTHTQHIHTTHTHNTTVGSSYQRKSGFQSLGRRLYGSRHHRHSSLSRRPFRKQSPTCQPRDRFSCRSDMCTHFLRKERATQPIIHQLTHTENEAALVVKSLRLGQLHFEGPYPISFEMCFEKLFTVVVVVMFVVVVTFSGTPHAKSKSSGTVFLTLLRSIVFS